MKRARSEAASSTSGNHHLADNDASRWITQNHRLRKIDHDRDDHRNIIDDHRRLRARSLTPPQCSQARDVTPSGRGSFHALASSLRQVVWLEKFKPRHVDKYDSCSNPEEFIQVYHTIIEATGGDDRVHLQLKP
jgi:hypothetical protein